MPASAISCSNKLFANNSLDELHKIFRHDIWYVIRGVYERLKGVDWVRFLACDVIKKVFLNSHRQNTNIQLETLCINISLSNLYICKMKMYSNIQATDHLEKIRLASTSTTGAGGSGVNGNTDPLGRMFTNITDQPTEPPIFHVQPFLMEVNIILNR